MKFELLDVNKFYKKCVKEYHKLAKKNKLAKRGLMFVPELISCGSFAILKFLQNEDIMNASENPNSWYSTIVEMVLKTGMVYAHLWHFSMLKREIIDAVKEKRPKYVFRRNFGTLAVE